MVLFGIEVQVSAYFDAIVPCACPIYDFINGLAAVPGYEFAFPCIFHQIEAQAGVRYTGFANFHPLRASAGFGTISVARRRFAGC